MTVRMTLASCIVAIGLYAVFPLFVPSEASAAIAVDPAYGYRGTLSIADTRQLVGAHPQGVLVRSAAGISLMGWDDNLVRTYGVDGQAQIAKGVLDADTIADGELFVADRPASHATSLRIRRYDASGMLASSFGNGGEVVLDGSCRVDHVEIRPAPDASLLVIVTTDHVSGGRYSFTFKQSRLVRIDAAGRRLPDLSPSPWGDEPCGTWGTFDAVHGQDGVVIVTAAASSTTPAAVTAYRADGTRAWQYDTSSNADADTYSTFEVIGVQPDGITLGRQGSVRSSVSRILRIDPYGVRLPDLDAHDPPARLARNGDWVNTSLADDGYRIVRRHPDGTPVEDFGFGGALVVCPQVRGIRRRYQGELGWWIQEVSDRELVMFGGLSTGQFGSSYLTATRLGDVKSLPEPPGARLVLEYESGWVDAEIGSTTYLNARAGLHVSGIGCGGPGGVEVRNARWRGSSVALDRLDDHGILPQGRGWLELGVTDSAGTSGMARYRMVVDYLSPRLVLHRRGRFVKYRAIDRGAAGSVDRGRFLLPADRRCQQSLIEVRDRAGNITRAVVRSQGTRMWLDRRHPVIAAASRNQLWHRCWSMHQS